jgi:hypothetical protein
MFARGVKMTSGVSTSMTPELTEEMITEAMARAEKVACRPGDDRCYPLPYDVKSAQQTCTPKGRCKVGWIVANSGRESWDVWLDLHTGEGRLRRQTR